MGTFRCMGLAVVAAGSAIAVPGCDMTVLRPNPAATRLAFAVQPANVSANHPMTPAIEVTVLDDGGSPVPDLVGSVTVSLGGNPGDGTLSGSLTRALSNGIATFSDLTIDGQGSGYTLVASAAGLLPATSGAFTVACITNCWTAKAPMPTRRTFFGVGVVNGMLYAVGGLASGTFAATLEAYHPGTNTWITRAPLPTPRSGLAVAVLNGVLYAVGGRPPGADATGIVEAYDAATNTWATKAAMPTARSELGLGVTHGRLYAIGGIAQNLRDTAVVEAYDPGSDTWATMTPMPTARSGFGTAVANDVIYVFGGEGPVSPSSAMEAYDPGSNAWTEKAPMPTPRSGLGAAGAGGFIYAVGGRSNEISSAVERYDPVSNTWAARAPLPTARVLLSIGTLDGILYAIGGSTATVPFPGTNEAYQPW